MFEQQVAHGYLSWHTAGFVDSYEKNPVLLNYGIDESVLPNRFIRAAKYISIYLQNTQR